MDQAQGPRPTDRLRKAVRSAAVAHRALADEDQNADLDEKEKFPRTNDHALVPRRNTSAAPQTPVRAAQALTKDRLPKRHADAPCLLSYGTIVGLADAGIRIGVAATPIDMPKLSTTRVHRTMSA
jgi:hypothetical protein